MAFVASRQPDIQFESQNSVAVSKEMCSAQRMRVSFLAALCAAFAVIIGCSKGETIAASFDEAGSLQVGDHVRVAGVDVGEIKAIRVADGKARVEMAIREGQDLSLRSGACARITGRTVEVVTGVGDEFDAEVLPACAPTLADTAAELRNAAVMAATTGAREAAHELTKAAAEFSRGLNDGSDELREAGNNLTMAGRAIAEGVEEGSR